MMERRYEFPENQEREFEFRIHHKETKPAHGRMVKSIGRNRLEARGKLTLAPGEIATSWGRDLGEPI